MKKLLLMAAAAFAYCSAVAEIVQLPVATQNSLTNEALYFVYDAAHDDGSNNETTAGDYSRYAFRWDNNGSIHGTHIKPQNVTNELTANHVWKAITNDNGATWSFQNVGTSKYWSTTSAGTTDEATHTMIIEATDKADVFKVKKSSGNDRFDGNGGTNCPFVWWAGSGHDIKFFEAQLADGSYTFKNTIPAQNQITISLPLGSDNLNLTAGKVPVGASIADYIPAYLGYEVSGETPSVTEGADTYNVSGNWTYLDKVGRIHNRLGQGARRFWSYDAAANNVKTQKSDFADVPTTDRLFKLNGKIEDNKLYVNVQNVVAGEGKYLNVENSDNNSASFTETVQWFEVRPSKNSNQGFMMGVEGNTCVQDYYGNPTLGAYTGDCTNDPSAVISFFEVTVESATAAFTNAVNALEGEGVGNYSFTEDGQTKKAELLADVTNNPLAISLDNYTALVEARSLNMPVAGRFYRLKGYNNYYLNNKEITIGDATRIQMQPTGDGNNGAKSVVYYSADGNLVSLLDGEVLGNFSDDARCFVMKDSGNAGVITFEEGTQTGKYLIKVSGSAKNYYAFGGWTDANNHQYEVDRGEGSVAGDSRYYWTIEELTPGSYLPLPVADGETAISFYLPCALKVRTDRMTGYTLEMNVGETEDHQPVSEVVKTSTEEAMAANTVHYAELATNATISDGSVFLQIDSYPEAVAQNGESAITGKFYTFTKQADKSYFHAITTADSDKFFSLNNDATTVKGFTGYIEMAAPSDHAKANGYKLVTEKTPTTGIEEIVAGGENGAKVIYDLQGRRVANASKGIFIINGVKTLVK